MHVDEIAVGASIVNKLLGLKAYDRHLTAGRTARSVIGGFDEPKLASSVVFFATQRAPRWFESSLAQERIAREDQELHDLLVQMAQLMRLNLDP